MGYIYIYLDIDIGAIELRVTSISVNILGYYMMNHYVDESDENQW